MSAGKRAPVVADRGSAQDNSGSNEKVARRKPVLRVLRAVPTSKLNAPKSGCPVCLGRRLILLDTWPNIRYGRCPACTGTDPTTGAAGRDRVSYTLLDGRREAA